MSDKRREPADQELDTVTDHPGESRDVRRWQKRGMKEAYRE